MSKKDVSYKCWVKRNICTVLAILFLILSIVCVFKGFGVKNDYYSSESYSSLNKNAYVGGDAYNYIINGTYFTGFVVMGSSFVIVSLMSLLASFYFGTIEQKLDIKEQNTQRLAQQSDEV